jgi:hypothetical protein
MKTLREHQAKHMERAQASAIKEAVRVTGSQRAAKLDWEDTSVLKLREAVGEGAFPQLLRAGVQQFLFDGYLQPPVIYDQIVRAVNSNKRQELYAPLYQTELPVEIHEGDPFPESNIQGLNQQLLNKKWGRMLSFARELVDDDQTGQIQDRANGMGQRMKITEEIQAINAIFGQYLADGTTAAWSTTIGPLGNRAGTYGAITEAGIEAADVALQQMTDPTGQNMLVNPTHIVHATVDKFTLAILLHSAFNPVAAASAGTGAVSGAYAINPLEGLYTPLTSRFVPNKGQDNTNGAWQLMEPQKGIVWQDRDPLEVLMEMPAAGESFTYDAYRYRVRRRFAVGIIESRFAWSGN